MDVHPSQVEVKKSFVLTMVMIIFLFVGIIKMFLGQCLWVYIACLVKLFHNHVWHKKLVFLSNLVKVELSLCKIRKADSLSVSRSNALYKTKFLFHSPTDATPQFL